MKVKNIFIKLLFNFALISFVFSGVVLSGNGVVLGDDVIMELTEITQALLVVAGGVCVGKIIHIGILYVSSMAMDKSNAKSAFLPWIIGTFLCFGAAIVGPAVINILKVGANVLDY